MALNSLLYPSELGASVAYQSRVHNAVQMCLFGTSVAKAAKACAVSESAIRLRLSDLKSKSAAPTLPRPKDKPILGWRALRFVDNADDNNWRIEGLFGGVWKSRTMHALCYSGETVRGHKLGLNGKNVVSKHLKQKSECSCGIWAYYTADRLDSYSEIYTLCSAWGSVARHQSGWKAEDVRIEQVYLNVPSILQDLKTASGAFRWVVTTIDEEAIKHDVSEYFGLPVEIIRNEEDLKRLQEYSYQLVSEGYST